MTGSHKKNRKITGKDIATAAGVAPSTVYFSLKNDLRVKENTRKRIQMLAEQMGFRPKASARALRDGRTHTVGVLFTHPKPEQRQLIARYAPALERISNILAEKDYHLSLAGGVSPEHGREKLPRLLHEVAIDGALLIYTPKENLLDGLEALDVPFVVMDGQAPEGIFSVSIDECHAAELAVEHLAGLGHKKIACLAVIRKPDSYSHRMWQYPRGYARAMAKAQLIPNVGWDEPDLPIERLKKLWDSPQRPTALITYNDTAARDIIVWLSHHNISVPKDVSVVALLDNGNAEIAGKFGLPTITSTKNRQEKMANIAIEILLSIINNPPESGGIKPIIIEPKLVQRKSSGPAPEA